LSPEEFSILERVPLIKAMKTPFKVSGINFMILKFLNYNFFTIHFSTLIYVGQSIELFGGGGGGH